MIGTTWREEWKAWIRRMGRERGPALLSGARSREPIPLPERLRTQQLQPLPRNAETGPITPLRETAIIPATKLFLPQVRETRELVSSAIHWFYQRHGCLPNAVALNPLRCLAISESRDFFSVSCDDIGCYTVEVCQAASLSVDTIWLVANWAGIEDLYL